MKEVFKWVLLVSVGLFFLGCDGLQKERVDLIIHNATIYTVNESFSKEEALAVRDGVILEIGPEHQIMNRYQSEQTINAEKQFVYPGFIDGHCHFLGYGLSLQKVNLQGTKSWEECLSRTREFAKTHEGIWITGRGWDQNDWESKEYPTNVELNRLFPDQPVLLSRIDGHGAMANSKALELAAITRDTQVEGGMIIVENGEPTGVLVDNAVDLVWSVIPSPSQKDLSTALLKAQENCFKVGLTTVNDAGLDRTEIELIQEMQHDSVLKMNVYAMISDGKENLDYFLKNGIIIENKLTVRSVKVYADGALGSRGAAMKSAYSDDPHNHGMILTPIDHMAEVAAKIYNAGFQMNTHCIGDSANKLLLHIYANVLKGVNDKRWRIEHAQVVQVTDLDLFRKYTIIPSVQPTHATSDMYWAEERLGADRIETAYAYKDLLMQNYILALGTDFPIEDISPLKTFYSAVFRMDASGYPEGGFNPENALTPEEALKGITIWNAMSNFEEHVKGSLEVGKKANITMLNIDVLKVRAEDFKNVNVVTTIVDGEIVYQK
ncbi:MAG: putative amidohydrolase YtcJ [Salibacteraceae bacterium]|jgi:predicted amidohydrolase YtcJ